MKHKCKITVIQKEWRDAFRHMPEGKFCSQTWDTVILYGYRASQGGLHHEGPNHRRNDDDRQLQ